MSVPTNNLYNFIAQSLDNKFSVKYFYPWGAKGFENIIDNEEDSAPPIRYDQVPVILCHDQEPLDFDLYNDDYLLEQLPRIISQKKYIRAYLDQGVKNLNLRWIQPDHTANHWVLLHSELNSPQVTQYESTGLFKCAYWWSHAVIALDWYRFARYDNRLAANSEPIKANFLVYARGTSYGFKTFQPYIDESYDSEQDPEKRMDKVLAEMHRINNSSDKYQKFIWDGCAEIAAYNKQLFFDDKFIWRVKTELRRNVHTI